MKVHFLELGPSSDSLLCSWMVRDQLNYKRNLARPLLVSKYIWRKKIKGNHKFQIFVINDETNPFWQIWCKNNQLSPIGWIVFATYYFFAIQIFCRQHLIGFSLLICLYVKNIATLLWHLFSNLKFLPWFNLLKKIKNFHWHQKFILSSRVN